MKKFKLSFLVIFIISTSLLLQSGCKKPEDLEKEGDYAGAYELYMKNIRKYENSLSGTYATSQLSTAEKYGISLAEAYYKAAECKMKMGDSAAAQELYKKAAVSERTVTEKYPVTEKIKVPAGYDDVWKPGGYKEVWIDGGYKDVWVDGGYQDVWVDGYYDENGNFVDGHYEQVYQEGHYDTEYVEGHYEEKYVEGHYETEWVPEHYEMKTHYETRDYTFKINSVYVDMAKSKITGAKPSQGLSSTGASSELQTAKEKLDAAYKIWIQSGQKTSGSEYSAYVAAKKAYDALRH